MSEETETAETYLIVRVTHDKDEHRSPTRITNLARVRQAIHDVAEEYELSVGDIVFFDRPQSPLPPTVHRATVERYQLVQSIYREFIALMEPHLAARKRQDHLRVQNTKTEAEKIQHRALGRARRALNVIERYIAKYGEDGLRPPFGRQKRGRHEHGVPLLTGAELQQHIEDLKFLPEHCGVTMALIYTSDGPTLKCPECKREWKAVHA